jgi:glycosyltransferase involved in cell wall biosynthesis
VPLVSVVIPVRDDPAGVQAVTAALERQTLPRADYEVIVAVDGGMPPQVPPGVRTEPGPPRNSYAARNRGARAARAEVLAFTDADCLPAPDWLERGLAALEGADVVAGAVRLTIMGRATPWALLDVEQSLDQEAGVRRNVAVTANLFMRRATFDAIGGFDETLPSGSDHDAVGRTVRAGAVLRYAEDAMVRHPARDGARALLANRWFTLHHGAMRWGRDGGQGAPGGKLLLIPFVGGIAERMLKGLPLTRLDARRLAFSGIEADRGRQLVAALADVLVVSPVTSVARLTGSIRGVRLRRGALDE